MKFEIKDKGAVIGICSFDRADPPMGFVSGTLIPTHAYNSLFSYSDLDVFAFGSDERVSCESVTLEDFSKEMGELCIEVTALLSDSDEFDKYFSHHRDNYNSQFM